VGSCPLPEAPTLIAKGETTDLADVVSGLPERQPAFFQTLSQRADAHGSDERRWKGLDQPKDNIA
jgi:hypothetical protein